jgi:DNA mismatch endonuclease (patch repair protein)
MDRLSKEKRSHIMSCVRSFGNRTTEVRLRAHLIRAGLTGWRVQGRELFGKPDFVFSDSKLALFIDSCFWHGCAKHYRKPATNMGYWARKVAYNRSRDRLVNLRLRSEGWSVLRIWEHELLLPDRVLAKIKTAAYGRGE